MGFLSFVEGFAEGGSEVLDRQAEEDRRLVETALISAKDEAKTYSEKQREHQRMLQQASQLVRVTGKGDTGIMFQELQLGLSPEDILQNIEKNPNRYFSTDSATPESPTSAAPTNFDIGAAAVGQFGGPTKEAATAMDSAISGGVQSSLRTTESSNNPTAFRTNQDGRSFGGLVQMGAARLTDYSNATGAPAMTPDQYAALPEAEQATVENWHFNDLRSQIRSRGLDQYIGQTINGVPMTEDGMIAVAHLGGIGGLSQHLSTQGSYNPSDELGTSLSDYAARHGGASPTDTQMYSSGLANPTGTAPVQESAQEQSGFDRFRSGTQRLFGMDTESRQARIQEQVDAGRSALGLDNVSNEGFAVPPSNFRINVGSGGADLSDLVGKDKEYINQWMVINGDTLTEQDRSRVSAISDRATGVADFDSPEDVNEAVVRYNMAIADGNPAEADLLATYIGSALNQNTGQVPVQVKIAPRPGMSVEEMVSEGVSTQLAVQSFVDGQIVYRNTAGEVIPQNQIIGTVEEEEKKALANVSSVLRTDIREYQASRRGLFAFTELARDMGRLVEDNQAVTTKVAGGVSAIVSFTREGATAIDVVQGMFGEGRENVTLSEVEIELAERGIIREGESLNSLGSKENLERILGASTVDLAEAKRVFDAMAIIATFRAGGLEGQSGQAMSNKDFDRLSQFLTAARSPEGFRRSVGGYLGNLVETVRQQERDLLSDGAVESFRTNYFRNPIVTSTFDRALSQRPATQSALEYFSSGNTNAAPTQQQQPALSIPAGAIDMLKQNADNPAILRAFEDKYGVSATQYLNGGQ